MLILIIIIIICPTDEVTFQIPQFKTNFRPLVCRAPSLLIKIIHYEFYHYFYQHPCEKVLYSQMRVSDQLNTISNWTTTNAFLSDWNSLHIYVTNCKYALLCGSHIRSSLQNVVISHIVCKISFENTVVISHIVQDLFWKRHCPHCCHLKIYIYYIYFFEIVISHFYFCLFALINVRTLER